MNFAAKRHGGKILEIRTIGDEILRKHAQSITTFDENLGELIGDMLATMYAADGIGLAAPQIGKSLKLVAIDVSACQEENETCELDGRAIQDIAKIMPLILVNPAIEAYSEEICEHSEGCLSIPEFCGHIRRPKKITLRFADGENIKHTLACDGILARCAQHEIDHLHGKLYTDLFTQKDRKHFLKYLAKYRMKRD
jgi:peptide deformylase